MIRLLIVSAEENYSGGEVVMLNLAHQFLRSKKYKVEILVRQSSAIVEKLVNDKQFSEVQVLHMSNLKRLSEGSFIDYFINTIVGNLKLYKLIAAKKYDVVIYNDMGTSTFGYVAKLLIGIKSIVSHKNLIINTIHSLYIKYIFNGDILVCPSNSVRRSVETKLNKKKIRVIYHGVKVSSKDYSNKFEAERDLRIVMAGRITRWKGFHIFIKAVKLLQDRLIIKPREISFEIVGKAFSKEDKRYQDEMQEYVKENNLTSLIRFSGFHPLTNLLPNTHCLVHASIEPEPFGMVVLEGMQYGCIVIASSDGGPTEIITHGEDGFLYEPGNSNKLSILLENFIKHASEPSMRKISTNAMHTVREKFDLKAEYNEYHKIIQELL